MDEQLHHVKCATPIRIKLKIEALLNLFPEVRWDRYSGQINRMAAFGWIDRKDGHGRSDFLSLIIVNGEWLSYTTSSAEYSKEFGRRLGLEHHNDCRRIEHDFPAVKNTVVLQLRQLSIPA